MAHMIMQTYIRALKGSSSSGLQARHHYGAVSQQSNRFASVLRAGAVPAQEDQFHSIGYLNLEKAESASG